jgi:AcrR family transcriptional regulator
VNSAAQHPGKPARRYQSRRRAQAAADTRSAILDAALHLFAERGYNRVTVQEIAHEASIAVPTVYASTGGKAAILSTIISDAMRDPVVGETLAAIDECGTPPDVLRALTHGVRVDNERHHGIVAITKDAAASDEIAASILARSNDIYRQALAHAADRVQEMGALRPGLTRKQAVDMLWFYLGHQAWNLLVSDQGWTWDDAERWLCDQLAAALLLPAISLS